ncbi:MAG: hypothetical protein RL885_24080 [Planctomycetota bacterium]
MFASKLSWIVVLGLLAAACTKDPGPPPEESSSRTTGNAGLTGNTPMAAPTDVQPGDRLDLGGISVEVPEGWVVERPSSNMRRAQFRLPGEGGESAEMIVFFFGAGQGGSVQMNIDRWIGQYEQPGGRSSADAATIDSFSANGMKITTVEIEGTLVAPTNMNNPAAGNQNVPNQAFIGGIVESPAGKFFFKTAGPQAVVDQWSPSVKDFLKSVQSN